MKTKAIFFLGAVAVITLSFTFVNSSDEIKKSNASEQPAQSEPVGGFASDEIVK